ncbi:MAG: penicillin acylase family protein, partial [Phycisphaerales bacterium]|nr:penicillin acylase family protein [Phycisphaerales bacterium]
MLSELLLPLLLVSFDENHTIPGLLADVVVTIDDRGVPKITGKHRADVIRVQGWMHARDRLFQMDGLRRVSSARLEGLAGPQARGEDDRFRKFRMLDAADEIFAALPEDQRLLLMAYADGVNAGAKAHPKTLEHTILQTNFEPWKPRDSICVLHTMWAALSIERRMELVRGVISNLGPELFDFLARGRSHWDAPIETFADEPLRLPTIPSADVVNLREDLERSQTRGLVQPVMAMLGSNNWAVSKERSATGYAIMANDPHLPLSAPGYWYRADLHWPGINAMGASQPGLPGATVGGTDHLSWGLTNTGGNFMDYAEIKIRRDDEGWWFDTFGPKERLRGVPLEGETLVGLRSSLGPLVEVMNQEEDDAVVRFAVWTALRPESANLTQFDLLEAKNVDEGVAVTSAWFGPSQNVVMADASGRIGWTISGFIPKRLGFDGSTPVPWSADCRWDWGSQAPRPSLVDPESGVLFTANNRVAGWEYAPAIGENWDPGYRASRI